MYYVYVCVCVRARAHTFVHIHILTVCAETQDMLAKITTHTGHVDFTARFMFIFSERLGHGKYLPAHMMIISSIFCFSVLWFRVSGMLGVCHIWCAVVALHTGTTKYTRHVSFLFPAACHTCLLWQQYRHLICSAHMKMMILCVCLEQWQSLHGTHTHTHTHTQPHTHKQTRTKNYTWLRVEACVFSKYKRRV